MARVTPTQLRAYSSVVRLGSVKAAADALDVSEAAVSMHVTQLRREFDDRLFTRTASGLAFTPGGLRLASRAVEILGLQDRTRHEVTQAGHGRRMLRLAGSALFAEHAAPGLIGLFASRAADLDVELSVHPSEHFPELLRSRAVDLAIGPAVATAPEGLVTNTFLNYEVLTVAPPTHQFTAGPVPASLLRTQTWHLGPSAAGTTGAAATILRTLAVPESAQRIFQSDAAALEEARSSCGIALALRFAVAADLAAGGLVALEGTGLRVGARWATFALPGHMQVPAAAELLRFITTPRATQAMVRGQGVKAGRFRPSVHVTLWS